MVMMNEQYQSLLQCLATSKDKSLESLWSSYWWSRNCRERIHESFRVASRIISRTFMASFVTLCSKYPWPQCLYSLFVKNVQNVTVFVEHRRAQAVLADTRHLLSHHPLARYALPDHVDGFYGETTKSWYLALILFSMVLDMHRHRIITKPMLQSLHQRWQAWVQRHTLKNQIIVRDRKRGYEDILVTIPYRDNDLYWNAVFSDNFQGGKENGMYVVHVSREGTTQQAVQIFSVFLHERTHGMDRIRNYIHEACKESVEVVTNRVQHLLILADKWHHSVFGEAVMSIVTDYMDKTLYDTVGTTSLQRLKTFVTQNPVMAEYIWKGNFSTENDRSQLATRLCISNKRRGAFVRAATVNALREWISHFEYHVKHRDPFTDVPAHLVKQVKKAQYDIDMARQGVPVGFTGRYISSDEIVAAQQRYHDALRTVDQWRGQKHLQRHRALPC